MGILDKKNNSLSSDKDFYENKINLNLKGQEIIKYYAKKSS